MNVSLLLPDHVIDWQARLSGTGTESTQSLTVTWLLKRKFQRRFANFAANFASQMEAPEDVFFLQRTLSTPAHISSLAFGHAGHLFAGSGMVLHITFHALVNICQMMALFVSTISRHTKY